MSILPNRTKVLTTASLLVSAALLLPATSNAAIVFLSEPWAPSIMVGAGMFSGTSLTLNVTDEHSATYFGANGSLTTSLTTTAIVGSGSVTVREPGQGAQASIFVPFRLSNSGDYVLSSAVSISAGEQDSFHNAFVGFGVFNIRTHIIDTSIEFGESGFLNPLILGPDDAFFILARAIDAKGPGESRFLPPATANFNFSFILDPPFNVSEPPLGWLLLVAGVGVFVVNRRGHPKSSSAELMTV